MFNKKHRIAACLTALLLLVFLPATTFGQGAGVSLAGTAADSSGGVVSGVSVVARNVDTGVETRTTTSDRGQYTFPSLPVGTYQITAEAPGFSRFTSSNLRLSVGSQSTLNISLAVAGSVTSVDVTGVTESVILEAGASTGTLLQEEILAAVPMLTTNIMDLVNLMGGVTPTSDQSLNPGAQTFAGVAASNVNIQRDGMTVSEVSMNTGINASTSINSEMVAEFKMVLSPVDAEMGRGAGQVQMTTRSGSNAFHGSAVWNNQNTALDAKDFSTKNGNIGPPWRNLNNYMLTASGPVIKNKTFFFVTWEHQLSRVKLDYTARAMSNCARVGIYRYIGGATPGPATVNNSMNVGGDSNSMPSVDLAGNILDRNSGATFLSTTGATAGQSFGYAEAHPSHYLAANLGPGLRPTEGLLQYESVFGPLTSDAKRLIDQDVRDPLNPCAAFAASSLWNPNPGNPNNPANYGVSEMWDQRPWGVGYDGRAGRAYRSAFDPTGFVNRFTYDLEDGSNVMMPPVNYFSGNGDGLNIASHRWTRGGIGGREGTIYGTGGDPNRKSITFKVDHNINSNHRLSGTYTHENFATDEHEAIWPAEYGGEGGLITRAPRTFISSLTSTIRPTVLNEFRFGYQTASIWTRSAINYSPGLRDTLEYLMPKSQTQNMMALVGIGEGSMDFHTDSQTYNWESHPVGSRGNISASQGRDDARWSFGDTVTWMKGAHSFKGGVEYRRQNSVQEIDGSLAFGRAMSFGAFGSVSGWPVAFGGANGGTTDRRQGMLGQHPLTLAGENWTNLTRRANSSRDCHSTDCTVAGTNGTAGLFTTPYQMMSYFAGSTAAVSQFFFMVPDNDKNLYPYGARWNNSTDPNELSFSNDTVNQELSFFFKDDWRVNSSLTLNLGVRWEYYGVPYAKDGRTLGLVGGSSNIYGASNPLDDANRFMHERSLRSGYESISFGDLLGGGADLLPMETRYQYIGPGSPDPDRMAWNRDLNNFAPHIGFAWQLPWFGRGMTTLRGGWSISYASLGSQDTFNGWIANVSAAQPTMGVSFSGEVIDPSHNRDNSGSTLHYMDLEDLSCTRADCPLPMRPRGGRQPLKPLTTGYFSGTAMAIDENLSNAMTHSINASLTRNIGRALTLDVRYIGTLGRNQTGTINVNQTDFVNTGLADEFEKIRRDNSYQSPLINSLIPLGMYNATMRTQGATLSGSDQLRNQNGGGANLTSRDYLAIANVLVGNGGYTPNPLLGEGAMLFRNGCLPEQRRLKHYNYPVDGKPGAGDPVNPCEYHTPLNFLRANPQHGTANLQTNTGVKSNYHSMQTQVTLRPTHGLNFQATWTWSRALSNSGWTNYLGERDYNLTGSHRSHTLNIFGNYELPFGSRGIFFRGASGAVKKAIEGWQIGWVTAMRSGSPTSITGANTRWGNNSWPILVRPDLWDNKAGKAEAIWTDDGRFAGGRYFGDGKWTRVMDPGVCNTNPNAMDQILYANHCYDSGNNTVRGTTRAIAVADPSRAIKEGRPLDPVTQAPWALLYTEDTLGADGFLYKKDTPVIVFRNATGGDKDLNYNPLTAGNFRANSITNPGQFTLDANLQKSVEFMEGKRLELRIDAANILNHAELTGTAAGNQRYLYGGRVVTASAPGNLGLNSSGNVTLGNLPGKVGHRTFQARLALRF